MSHVLKLKNDAYGDGKRARLAPKLRMRKQKLRACTLELPYVATARLCLHNLSQDANSWPQETSQRIRARLTVTLTRGHSKAFSGKVGARHKFKTARDVAERICAKLTAIHPPTWWREFETSWVIDSSVMAYIWSRSASSRNGSVTNWLAIAPWFAVCLVMLPLCVRWCALFCSAHHDRPCSV